MPVQLFFHFSKLNIYIVTDSFMGLKWNENEQNSSIVHTLCYKEVLITERSGRIQLFSVCYSVCVCLAFIQFSIILDSMMCAGVRVDPKCRSQVNNILKFNSTKGIAEKMVHRQVQKIHKSKNTGNQKRQQKGNKVTGSTGNTRNNGKLPKEKDSPQSPESWHYCALLITSAQTVLWNLFRWRFLICFIEGTWFHLLTSTPELGKVYDTRPIKSMFQSDIKVPWFQWLLQRNLVAVFSPFSQMSYVIYIVLHDIWLQRATPERIHPHKCRV